MGKFKLDKGVLLGLASAGLGVLSFIVSMASDAHGKKVLKNEITEEVLKELSSKN